VPKFEYIKVPAEKLMSGDSVMTPMLNTYGEEGWEMVYATNWNGKAAYFYFKREKEDAKN
jgi:hypothetical protein